MSWNKMLEIFIAPKKPNPDESTSERGGDAATPSGPPPPPSAGDFDLTNIYRERGISPIPFTAEQTLDLLGSWLRETRGPSFSELLKERSPSSSAAIAEDARLKIDALTAAAEHLPGEFADFITATEDEIAKLETEIREKRDAMERAKATGEQITQQCRTEAERLNTLLRFLG